MILLDTNVCIGIMHAEQNVVRHLMNNEDKIGVPGMVEGELYYGAEKSRKREENLLATENFLNMVEIIHTDDEIMAKFGELKAELEMEGMRVDDADVIIAATAIVKNAVLVTGNVRHFSRFRTLDFENWFDC